MKKFISLFMWGYQESFRISLELRAKQVFERLGVELKPSVLLVGVRRLTSSSNPNAVCIEPEDGNWPLKLFTTLLETVEKTVKEHPLQSVFYGHEPTTRDKPENIRRDSVRTSVQAALSPYDQQNSLLSFCGQARPIGDYHVVPVIQLPKTLLEIFPPLKESSNNQFYTAPSLVHAAMDALLDEASKSLERPEPGRTIRDDMRDADEIIVRAASSFMRAPGAAIGDNASYLDLFGPINLISSLMYEGLEGTGGLLLADPQNPSLKYVLRLEEPVPYRDHRWARKILQMTSSGASIIGDCEAIHGLGTADERHDPSQQDIFAVDFLGHYQWQLRCGLQVLMRCRYGRPQLPHETLSHESFIDTLSRLFPQMSFVDQERIWKLCEVATQQSHGSMILVAADAAAEARRLAGQGTVIEPTELTVDLFRRVSGIDGSIIVDQNGICHAIGVILDGPANAECRPSRGSRFNSAVRYVSASKQSRLAIVVSEDRTLDVIPYLRSRIRKSAILNALSALEQASLENYHLPRSWIDEHRFYLDAKECERANIALDRIEKLPRDVGEIMIITPRLHPDANMNDSYFIPE